MHIHTASIVRYGQLQYLSAVRKVIDGSTKDGERNNNSNLPEHPRDDFLLGDLHRCRSVKNFCL